MRGRHAVTGVIERGLRNLKQLRNERYAVAGAGRAIDAGMKCSLLRRQKHNRSQRAH